MPNTVYVSELIPPHRMSVIENYTQGVGIDIRKIPHDEDGFLDLNDNQASDRARYMSNSQMHLGFSTRDC